MKLKRFVGVWVLLLLCPAFCMAASFSADMVETREGKTNTNKIYLLDHQYRLDIKEQGRDLSVLVDEKAGSTLLIVPSENVYVEMDNNDMKSLMSNPFAAYRHMVEKYEMQSAGKEKIGDVTCEKQVFTIQGKVVMTAWIAADYHFPIKVENKMNGLLVELKNLKPGGVTPDRFTIPAGFKKVVGLPLPPPDWAGDIAAAPVMAPPFETTLNQGQVVRIKPVKDFNIDIKARSLDGIEGSFSATAFKDGRPLKRITAFAGGGSKIQKEKPDEADEIVVRAASGSINVTAELVEAPEGIILTKHFLKSMSGKELHPDQSKAFLLRLSDRGDDGRDSRGTLTFYEGRAQHKKNPKKEEFMLAASASKVWKYDADRQIGTIDVMVLDGCLDIRLEQPEKAGTIPPSWAQPAVDEKPAAATAPTAPAKPTVPAITGTATNAAAPRSSGADCMVLILDASGSMWGQIDGKAKIAIAKEVMTELVDDLPGDLHVGLTVYGHRRKGDCADIEMVTPVQPLNGDAIKSQIAAITPKGKTPIGASLLQVAETLKGQPGNKVIVLVTDGLESCDQDPCEVARRLAAAGVVTKIHIVGFDLKGDALAQLKCIAEPSGGLLVGANNADELKAALTEVVTASLPHNLVVKGLDANHDPLYVSVQVSKAGQKVAGGNGSTLRYSLPAGSYSVAVRYSPLDQTVVLEDVAVEENRLTEKEVVFAESKIEVKSLDGTNKALYSNAIVYKAGTDEKIKESNASAHVFTLPPDVYDVKVTHGPTKTDQWLRDLETTAGGQLVKEVVFAKCELRISSLDGNNKALYSSAVVYKAGTDEKIEERNGSRHVFTLLPGAYDVKVTCVPIKKEKWLRNLSLQANDRIEQQVQFALGKIRITGRSPEGKNLYLGVTVYPAGGSDKIHQATGNPTFTLAPGAYDFRVRADQIKSEKWLRGVTIEDGSDKKEQVQF